MRVFIAGFQHETNTFAPTKADWAAFTRGESFPVIMRGEAMVADFGEPAASVDALLRDLDEPHGTVLSSDCGFPMPEIPERGPVIWGYGERAISALHSGHLSASNARQLGQDRDLHGDAGTVAPAVPTITPGRCPGQVRQLEIGESSDLNFQCRGSKTRGTRRYQWRVDVRSGSARQWDRTAVSANPTRLERAASNPAH